MNCDHQEEIIDSHEGTIICLKCGTVKDNTFIHPPITSNKIDIHETYGFYENVFDKFQIDKSDLTHTQTNKKENINNKRAANIFYNLANKNRGNISLKDISNLFQISKNDIKINKINIIDVNERLEKYTKMFNINYDTYQKLLRYLSQFKQSGHQPLTIIGGLIFKHFNNTDKKQTIKDIAKKLNISPISIYRFKKKFL